jgi:hypothetical protein
LSRDECACRSHAHRQPTGVVGVVAGGWRSSHQGPKGRRIERFDPRIWRIPAERKSSWCRGCRRLLYLGAFNIDNEIDGAKGTTTNAQERGWPQSGSGGGEKRGKSKYLGAFDDGTVSSTRGEGASGTTAKV